MSHSPYDYCPWTEQGSPYYASMLNAEAMPFMPTMPGDGQQHTLRGSAISFVPSIVQVAPAALPANHMASQPDPVPDFDEVYSPGSLFDQTENVVGDIQDTLGNAAVQQPEQDTASHQPTQLLDDDVDGEYEIDDEYQPPTTIDVHETGASDRQKSNTKSHSSRKSTSKLSAVSNGGIKKPKKKRTTRNKTVVQKAETLTEISGATFADKQRKAIVVINEQKKKDTLAEKLGQDIRVTRTGRRVKIEGVYWKAPTNDLTIPTTDREMADHAQKLVVAIRNNKDCKEVDTAQSFRNRWGDNATHFAFEELEAAAWDALVSRPLH